MIESICIATTSGFDRAHGLACCIDKYNHSSSSGSRSAADGSTGLASRSMPLSAGSSPSFSPPLVCAAPPLLVAGCASSSSESEMKAFDLLSISPG